ncbi:MAG: YaaR family protein [Bacillota bacterium]
MSTEKVRLGGGLTRVATTGRGERAVPVERVPFRQQLARTHAMHFNERIDRALAEIERFGNRLGETFSQHDLRAYREAIARLFRDLTHHMVEVRADLEWDSQTWEQRTMVTIRKVDEKLEELSRLVLDQEQDRIAILEAIGEIKGMLVDVRM